MAYRISVTREARGQFEGFSSREQRILSDGIAARLKDGPAVVSRAIKRLRPNPFAEYELRLGDLRVLYRVEEGPSEVLIVAVGRKVGNRLIVGGEEFHGHQGDLPQ